MVMFGLIMAGLGLAYQIVFPLRSHSYVNAKIVMIFHFIAGKSEFISTPTQLKWLISKFLPKRKKMSWLKSGRSKEM